MAATLQVFTRGGYLLYSSGKLEGNVLNKLISEHLLEERSASSECNIGQYSFKWKLDNQRDIVYVLAYRTVLALRYIDQLLDSVYRMFTKVVDSNGKNVETSYDFDASFLEASQKAEKKADSVREARAAEKRELEQAQEDQQDNEQPQQQEEQQQQPGHVEPRSHDSMPALEPDAPLSPTTPTPSTPSSSSSSSSATSVSSSSPPPSSGGPLSQDEIRRRVMAKRGGSGSTPSSSSSSGKKNPSSPPPKNNKVGRKWDDALPDKNAARTLNKSKDEGSHALPAAGSLRVDQYNLDLDIASDDDIDDDDDGNNNNNNGKQQQQDDGSKSRGFFGNLFRNLTGRTLDKGDLEPVLQDLQNHLISKNVASDVSKQLCASVQASLMGKHLGSLASVSATVNEALRVALVKILTPKKNIDILADCERANQSGRPYSVVFVGINGVGKSTNLAKVAAWLLSHKKKVLIAACDTFRSGAVEQLAVHCRNLDVPLFQQGYGHDAASIAQHAVRQAAKDHQDVVLIDTAGRMQDNEPLMQALAKLVAVNRPDLILFVGEALAGNDSVDQLSKFNQALIDYSGSPDPRTVDGIMLSKFDTVDDQVGTAVSLVYSSGLPIVFLGTGQHYVDLKKLNVNAVVKSLMK